LNASDAERLFQKLNASFVSARLAATPQSPTKNPDEEPNHLFLMLIASILLMITSICLQLLIIFRKPKQPEKTQKESTINMLSVFGQNSLGDEDNDDRF
jgi:heme/copper-type cytochrome/quinol oxidase subunit 3